ncbi:unnamed protein product [Paramecium octaurelia]|uniref:Uncharacterized protein n=1 Tax=Paramecium octaurelia TaxID=43137 RepID=A0A8S1TIM6_PAROT|nr:unnamed protein product [Paramecium octaurelia]
MYKDLDINELEKLKKEEAMLSLRKATTNIKERFGQSNYDILDEEFKSKTIGLVTREEFKRKRENIDRIYVQDLKIKQEEEEKKKLELKQKRKQEYKLKTTLLSFDQEQQEMNEKRNYGKDISVDTLYLPDMNREKKIEELTKIFTDEYQKNMEFQKDQLIDIIFQYWDAQTCTRTLRIRKNTSIKEFLELARKEIIRDFGFV